MRKVFICSPFRASEPEEQKKNIKVARRICRKALQEGLVPIAPHLFFPQFLSDGDEKERELGIHAGLVMLESADEVWVVGNRVSEGMAREIAKAGELGIPTKCVMDPFVADEHLLTVLGKE